MLPALQAAFDHAGKSKAALARDLGITTQTLYCYLNGKHLIPKNRRARFDRAFGAQVDWWGYEQEQAAAAAPEPPAPAAAPATPPAPRKPPAVPAAAPPAPKPARPPSPPPAPRKPTMAPVARPRAPVPAPEPAAGAWGRGVKPAGQSGAKAPAPTPKPAPAPAPAARKGFLASLFRDDGDDPFA